MSNNGAPAKQAPSGQPNAGHQASADADTLAALEKRIAELIVARPAATPPHLLGPLSDAKHSLAPTVPQRSSHDDYEFESVLIL